MIYSIFAKKYQDEKSPFAVAKLIKDVIRNTKNPFVVGWPGYISKSRNGVDSFYDEINPYPKRQLHGFFFMPLGGGEYGYMNEKFGKHYLPQPYLKDHSKILIVFSCESEIKQSESIDLNSARVKAILIGSSNQSSHTYCASPAPKGEADVLMIDVDDFPDARDDASRLKSYFEGTIDIETIDGDGGHYCFSKEICGLGGMNLGLMAKKLLAFEENRN